MKTFTIFAITSLISLSSLAATHEYEGQGSTTEDGTQVCGMQVEEIGGKLKLTINGVGLFVQTTVEAKSGVQNFRIDLNNETEIKKAMGEYFEEGGFLSKVSVRGTIKNSKPVSFTLKATETIPDFGSNSDSVKCKF